MVCSGVYFECFAADPARCFCFLVELPQRAIGVLLSSPSEIRMARSNSETTQSNTKPVSSSLFKSKTIFLHEWWLVKQQKGLAIGGVASMEKDREKVFLSTVILKRKEANVLETEDGITVVFRGFINTSRSCQNGFSSELCRHFMFGFPYDWKKYSAHSSGDEDINGITEFGDSNDFTNTVECECKDTTENLNSSQLHGDNGGNGVQDVAVESQAGNPEIGKSFKGIYYPIPCTGMNQKNTTKSPPTSRKKMKEEQFSRDRMEKQFSRQTIVEDSGNRRITRSISKRSHTLLEENEKATVTSAGYSSKRSLRL